jgi:dynein heavy chain
VKLKGQNIFPSDFKLLLKYFLKGVVKIMTINSVHLFSAAMIHWTRQIKEVLSSQDAFETAENSGPLEEIEFWKNRCADLSGISQQLDKPGVKKITEILQLAKSSYVTPFLKLSSQIKVGK